MCRHCLCEGCWTLPNWPSAWLRSLAEYVLFLFLSLFLLLFLFVRSFLAQVLCLRICKSQRKTMLEHKLNKCEIFYRYVCQPVCPYICVCVCVCWAACTKKQITFHRLVRAEQLILLATSPVLCFRLALTYPQQSCPHDRKLSGTKAPRRTLRTDSDPSTVGWPSAGRRQCPLSFVTAEKETETRERENK